MVLKLPDLVVKYTNDIEKYAIYEWRNDIKVGNFPRNDVSLLFVP